MRAAVQARRAFDNLAAVCAAAGGSLDDVVRVGLYLTDLGEFAAVNAVMGEYFAQPYPARSTVEVSALPKGAQFEVDAVMVTDLQAAHEIAVEAARKFGVQRVLIPALLGVRLTDDKAVGA